MRKACGESEMTLTIQAVQFLTDDHGLRYISRKVRSHPNALAPVNRLPVELLARILDDVNTWGKCSFFDPGPILVLTHVCRLWRQVAIGCATFWNRIDLDLPPQLVETFLRRSSCAPLAFRFNVDQPDLGSKLYYLRGKGARIQTLHVWCQHPPEWPLDENALRFPFHLPQIEYLAIDLGPSSPRTKEFAERMLQGVDNPRLRTLVLNVESLQFNIASLPTTPSPCLTHLCLTVPHDITDMVDVMTRLLRLIAGAPMLQHLNLAFSDLSFRTPEERLLPTPTLNYLRSITLSSCSFEQAFYFLEHLTLLSDILLCINDSWTKVDVSAHPEQLNIPPLSLFQNLTFMEIALSMDYMNWTANNAQFTSGFLFSAEGPDAGWTGWVERSHAALPFSHIQVLHLYLDDAFAISRLGSHILPQFVHLKELFLLSVHFEDPDDDLTLTLLEEVLPVLTRTDPTVCPELRVLGFRMDVYYESFPFSNLVAMAAARFHAGRPLSRFVYQPHKRVFDDEESHRSFADELSALSAFVDSVEYLHSPDEENICPFTMREGWNTPDGTSLYWSLVRDIEREPRYGMACNADC